jgi:phosphatidylglycerol:prolipoprotein diacylglycerol transferase
VLWVTLGIILGGRIGYVLFYNLFDYLKHPIEILKVWNGGMSFHGGFLGCVVAVVAFAYVRRISWLSLGDITCAVGPIGLFLGRLANFVNGELWGRATDVPWAMIFPSREAGGVPRHPSQLYEATLEGIVLFVILMVLIRRGALKRPGLIIGVFAICYALMRSFCELFREPDVQLGFLWQGTTMGMLLSIPLFFAGVGFVLYAVRHPARSPT